MSIIRHNTITVSCDLQECRSAYETTDQEYLSTKALVKRGWLLYCQPNSVVKHFCCTDHRERYMHRQEQRLSL